MQIDKEGQRWWRTSAGVPLLFFTCATWTFYQEENLIRRAWRQRNEQTPGGKAEGETLTVLVMSNKDICVCRKVRE